MTSGQRPTSPLASIAALAAAAALLCAAPVAAQALGSSALTQARRQTSISGGAPIGGLAPTRGRRHKVPPAPSKRDPGRWLPGVTVTEYWPAPEAWFAGRLVPAPGLLGPHRIDWLYSATGVSMQGDGIGLDGRLYHIQSLGDGGWVTQSGVSTSPSDGWAAGSPFWRAGGYWRNRGRAVTFPLSSGGWSAGPGRRYVALNGVSFSPGQSLPLRYYQSVAVDPGVIPLGSRVYVPAYRHDGHGGWFIAQDTGGAIAGPHIDVYRPPPASSSDSGQQLTGQRIYIIKPVR
jgi:3D (Asp-Asp-Asp) domain-containing protein